MSEHQSYHFDHIFAFTTDSLVPALLSSLLIDMAHRVIIEDHNISMFVSTILHSSPICARHTSIIHLEYDKDSLIGSKYVWAQKSMQPWGNPLPPQCSKCGSFRPWGGRELDNTSGPSAAVFYCKGKNINGQRCGHRIVFPKPDYKKTSAAGWLTFEWPQK
jgi:hypothetical protein